MYFPPPPKLKASLVDEIIEFEWNRQRPDQVRPLVVGLAIRGYRQGTIGNPTRNDVNEVDDLLAWRAKGKFHAVNANADPSRLGWNKAIGKPYAMLQPGIWDFYPGAHRGRKPAYRQADNAEVARKLGITQRDGQFKVMRMFGWNDPRNYLEWGWQQINIHPMTVSSTSSWACLTIPWDKSDKWIGSSQEEMKIYRQRVFSVILIEGPVN